MKTTMVAAEIGKIRDAVWGLKPWSLRIETWWKNIPVTSSDRLPAPTAMIQKAVVRVASFKERPMSAASGCGRWLGRGCSVLRSLGGRAVRTQAQILRFVLG